MANQPQRIDHQRTYTRSEFTALRAFVQRVPPATIGRLYLGEDEDGEPWPAATVERRMRAMQADLVALAIAHGSSVLADHLKASAKKHGSARLSAVSLKMVEHAAQLAVAQPTAEHSLAMWFRPMVAKRLQACGIRTLGELIGFANARGGSWWRAVPRIGAGRARHLVTWLRSHEATLGTRIHAEVEARDPLQAADDQIIEVGGHAHVIAPLERMALAHPLAGTNGANRAALFPYIQAHNDLEAVRAYLYRYRDRPKTLRAYTKELERFLLWAVTVQRKALSDLNADDCEHYKNFLKHPAPSLVGPRAPRNSVRWRPFAAPHLTLESQKYALRAVRAAFDWFVKVRYLAGNPWEAVNDPVSVTREVPIRTERALSNDLWQTITQFMAQQCAREDAARWRVGRAAVLLMAHSGLRREEVVQARREHLKRSTLAQLDICVWELSIVGKRSKERTVPVSPETVDALRAHWLDTQREFDTEVAEGPLLVPTVIPPTPLARKKHADKSSGYHPNSLNALVLWMMRAIAAQMPELSAQDQQILHDTSPHAFRHTFGTHAVADKVPLDVVQKVMGHESLQTTSLYVQAEKRRMVTEVGQFYMRRQSDSISTEIPPMSCE